MREEWILYAGLSDSSSAAVEATAEVAMDSSNDPISSYRWMLPLLSFWCNTAVDLQWLAPHWARGYEEQLYPGPRVPIRKTGLNDPQLWAGFLCCKTIWDNHQWGQYNTEPTAAGYPFLEVVSCSHLAVSYWHCTVSQFPSLTVCPCFLSTAFLETCSISWMSPWTPSDTRWQRTCCV